MADAANKFTSRIRTNFCSDIEETGENSFCESRFDRNPAVLVPAIRQTAKNTLTSGHSTIVYTLPKISRSAKTKSNLALSFRSSIEQFGVSTKVDPRLVGLRFAQNISNVYICRAQMPRDVEIELLPKLS